MATISEEGVRFVEIGWGIYVLSDFVSFNYFILCSEQWL